MSQSGSLRNMSGGSGGTDLHVARFIVSSGGTANGANYSTIASAITAAVAATGSQTIFIQPGNYTENLVLQPNINLVAFQADAQTPTVIITGKLTATFTGTCSISGIRLDTNGDYVCEITGTNPTVVNFISCKFVTQSAVNLFHCTNSTATMSFNSCIAECGSANTIFVFTAGNVSGRYSTFASGNSSVASTFANTNVNFEYCFISVPLATSGNSTFSAEYCDFFVTNVTALTHNASGNSFVYFSRFETGTASAISIGAGAKLPVVECAVFSTNANTITGAGTIFYGQIDFYGIGATSNINTTTQTPFISQIGTLHIKTPLEGAYGGTGIANTSLTIDLITGAGVGKVLTSDVSGNATWQAGGGGGSTVNFQAYLTSNGTYATGSTAEVAIFDTAISNVGSGYNTATGIFTAPSTGFYSFAATLFFTTGSGTTQYLIAYTGSVQSLRLSQIVVASAISSVAWSMPMTVGDTVKIQPFADGTGNFQLIGGALSSSAFNSASTFSGYKVN